MSADSKSHCQIRRTSRTDVGLSVPREIPSQPYPTFPFSSLPAHLTAAGNDREFGNRQERCCQMGGPHECRLFVVSMFDGDLLGSGFR